MEICLINPPIEDFYYTRIRRQPLGLLYIAATLLTAGYTVSLIDSHSHHTKHLELPHKFNYLKKYIDHNNPLLRFPFKRYSHFGISFQEIRQQILKSNATLFMISSMFTTYHQECEIIVSIIKECRPKALIAVGGYHASLHYNYFLQTIKVDFIVQGEGEIPAVRLAEAVFKNRHLDMVPGLCYIKDGIIIKNPALTQNKNIGIIPFPERSLLHHRQFKYYRGAITPIITSRGCPNNCRFCSGKIIWGNSHRSRSIKNIITEIDSCVKAYGITCFNFEDENLFVTNDRAIEILTALIHYRESCSSSLEFTAMNGTSIEKIDADIIRLMKKAGFNELNISLVTHSTSLQKTENRPFDTDHFTEIVQAAQKNDIKIRAYFILGLPSQTKKEIEATIAFLQSFKIPFYPSVYYNVWASPDEWKCQRSSAFFNETDYLSREDLLYFFNKCHLSD
ncbi:MAG: radical SAM protein [Spirochaetes bacterium]|jgi:anaerobic magnesium-protoporphyrin IX monomethyl ester cyclase|nr:radical SAM protein [Spirochaetota bacterium]